MNHVLYVIFSALEQSSLYDQENREGSVPTAAGALCNLGKLSPYHTENKEVSVPTTAGTERRLEKNTQIKINPLLLQIRKQMNHVLYVIFSAVNSYANFISNNSLVNLGQLHTEKARSNYLLQGNNKSMVIFVLKRQKVVR
jgi:hypothetical protein